MDSLKYHLSKYLKFKNEPDLISSDHLKNFSYVSFKEVYPSQKLQRSTPFKYGEGDSIFPSYPETIFPPMGVFTVPNGIIKASNGWIHLNKQNLFYDGTWYATYPNDIKKKKCYYPILPQKIKGTVLSLHSDFSLNNYGHFLLDSLSRFHLIEKAKITSNSYDWILFPGKKNSNRLSLAMHMGIDIDKIIWSSNYRFIKADKIIATTFPGLRRNYPKWSLDFLRNRLISNEPSSGKKLFIKRLGTRKISNSKAIEMIAKDYGFEIYQPEKSRNSRLDFLNASAVIGGHGAGLTDILFCKKGTPVLELLPSSHNFEYYYTVADSSDLKYGYLICQSENIRNENTTGPDFSDYYVNPDIFKNAIETHFGEIL